MYFGRIVWIESWRNITLQVHGRCPDADLLAENSRYRCLGGSRNWHLFDFWRDPIPWRTRWSSSGFYLRRPRCLLGHEMPGRDGLGTPGDGSPNRLSSHICR